MTLQEHLLLIFVQLFDDNCGAQRIYNSSAILFQDESSIHTAVKPYATAQRQLRVGARHTGHGECRFTCADASSYAGLKLAETQWGSMSKIFGF